MIEPLIEVVIVRVSANGIVDESRMLIAPAHIVSVTGGKHGASVVTLSTGQPLNVKQPFEALKKMLGVP